MRSRIGFGALIAVVLALFAAVGVISAQDNAYIPAIVAFSADTDTVSLPDVENGAVDVALDWRIINVVPGQVVAVDYWRQNGWQPAWSTSEVNPAVGSRTVTLQDTQSFAPPTFRLTLYDGRNIRDQRFLVIPYAETEGVPQIVSFASPTASVDPDDLDSGDATAEVNWQVINRPVNSQLVFDQVLPDGSAVNVEQARAVYYVPSSGRGSVAPVLPDGEQFIRLRLSLVDVITGEVYDTADVLVPFTGTTLPAVLPTGPEATPEATAEPVGMGTPAILPTAPIGPVGTPAVLPIGPTTAPAGPTIQTFTVGPATVAKGGSVTMTWAVQGATTVQISEVLPESTGGLTYVQLPASGSVSVPLPDAALTTVTYVLSARDAAGNESRAEQTVTVGS